MTQSHESPMHRRPRRRATPARITFWALIAIAAAFLLYEHRLHVLGYWPLAIFVLCPVLHLWMHRGHGGDGPSGGHNH